MAIQMFQTVFRRILPLVVCLFLPSCTFFMMKMMGVKRPQLYENQISTFDKVEKQLKDKQISYKQVFIDSLQLEPVSGEKTKKFTLSAYLTPQIFNNEGHLLHFDTARYPSCTNQPHQVLIKYGVPIDSLQSIDTIQIQDKLKTLKGVDWRPVDKRPGFDLYVFLNWSTYMVGPQEKNFADLSEKLRNKKVFYFFVNNDFYARIDSITN